MKRYLVLSLSLIIIIFLSFLIYTKIPKYKNTTVVTSLGDRFVIKQTPPNEEYKGTSVNYQILFINNKGNEQYIDSGTWYYDEHETPKTDFSNIKPFYYDKNFRVYWFERYIIYRYNNDDEFSKVDSCCLWKLNLKEKAFFTPVVRKILQQDTDLTTVTDAGELLLRYNDKIALSVILKYARGNVPDFVTNYGDGRLNWTNEFRGLLMENSKNKIDFLIPIAKQWINDKNSELKDESEINSAGRYLIRIKDKESIELMKKYAKGIISVNPKSSIQGIYSKQEWQTIFKKLLNESKIEY